MIQNPDIRTGATLQEYLGAMSALLSKIKSSQRNCIDTVKIFMLTEGKSEEFALAKETFPDIHLLLNSSAWLEAIDIMSQSQVIFRGESSFSALGANLCEDCTVITYPQKSIQRLPFRNGDPCEGHHLKSYDEIISSWSDYCF